MELRFACPQCGTENRISSADETTVIDCPRCSYFGLLPLDWAGEGEVDLCPICGSHEIFRQRDFHQRLGILIALGGVALAIFTRFLSLVAAGILDVVLYLTAPERLVCYRCRSCVRGHRPSDRHGRYDPRVDRRIQAEVPRERHTPDRI